LKVYIIKEQFFTAFRQQAELLADALTEMGYEVTSVFMKKGSPLIPPAGYDVYLYYSLGGPRTLLLPLPKFNNVFFEVSDTDEVSPLFLSFFGLNPIKALVVPSEFSKEAFLYSLKKMKDTVVNIDLPPIYVIPHALKPTIYKAQEINIKHPCVLIICPHSWERKGCDLAVDVVKKLKKEMDFHAIITSFYNDPRCEGLDARVGVLPDEEFYSLMLSCDVLFYPVRGGSFEIPVIEALSLGMDVVVTGQGPWMEQVLDKDHVYPIRISGKKRYWLDNPYHIGNFFEPDPNSAYEQLKNALLNISTLYEAKKRKKERLETVAPKYRETYHIYNIVKYWISLFKKLTSSPP